MAKKNKGKKATTVAEINDSKLEGSDRDPLSEKFCITLADGSEIRDFFVQWTMSYNKKTIWKKYFPFSQIAPSLQSGLAAKCKRSISDALGQIKESKVGEPSVTEQRVAKADELFEQLKAGIWTSKDGHARGVGYTGGDETVEFWLMMPSFIKETKTAMEKLHQGFLHDGQDAKTAIVAFGLTKALKGKTPTAAQVKKARGHFELAAQKKAEAYREAQKASEDLADLLGLNDDVQEVA